MGHHTTFRVRDCRKIPFFWIEHTLLETKGKIIGPYGIAVYTALAHFSNQEGRCFPSYQTIADLTGMSRRQVINKIQQLEKEGLIAVEKRLIEGQFTSCIFTLLSPVDPEPRPSNNEDRTSPNAPNAPGVVNDVHHPSAHDSPSTYEQELINEKTPCAPAEHGAGTQASESETQPETEKKKKTPSLSAGGYSVEFEQFWAAWPTHVRKRKKGDAWKAWQVIRPSSELLQTIIAAVEAQKDGVAWRKEDGEFIPLPSSWLRAKGWEDEVLLSAEVIQAQQQQERIRRAEERARQQREKEEEEHRAWAAEVARRKAAGTYQPPVYQALEKTRKGLHA